MGFVISKGQSLAPLLTQIRLNGIDPGRLLSVPQISFDGPSVDRSGVSLTPDQEHADLRDVRSCVHVRNFYHVRFLSSTSRCGEIFPAP
jgi:hypothetical protein